ncbi:MAG: inorganic phosphate transporter [Chloroflexi bacterium]|nr:inorganic phosphate transporter [Chloroflexota bacterium]
MDLFPFLVGLALLFNFLNGFNDSSGIVATLISSRALAPRLALVLTALCELAGPFLLGVAVAQTIGQVFAGPEGISVEILLAALLGAVAWNLFAWYFGIPSSSSHALVGGLVGAVSAGAGPALIRPEGLLKVLLALFISPVLGLVVGFLLTRLIFFLARNASNRINWFFKHGQALTAMGLALGHGANDAPKTMGVITLALCIEGGLDEFHVPLWVILACTGAMALGTGIGGWRLIKRLSNSFYKIRPVHGFGTQVSAALVVLGAALLGGPVSTTQVISSALVGVGAADRVKKVRWGAAIDIVIAWVLTIPAAALVAAGACFLIRLLT